MVLNSFLLGVIPVMGQQKEDKTYFKLLVSDKHIQ